MPRVAAIIIGNSLFLLSIRVSTTKPFFVFLFMLYS